MNVYAWAIKLQDLMSPALQKAQATYSRFGAGFERMTQRLPRGLRMATQSIDELKRKMDGLKGARELMVDTRQIRRATKEMDELQRKIDKLEGKSVKKESGGLMGFARGALPALGLAGLLAGAGDLAKSGMDREQTKVAFEQFVGKAGVDPMMKQLNKFADVTPYDNEQVYGAGRTLLSAKVGPKELNEKMTNIGNMSAVSQKDFGEMAASYAKIKQKGFADSGELHMEFGGTAVMDQLKKDLGVNGEQLFKMAEKRQIRFEDIDKAIGNLSAKGGMYEGGLEKLSNTAGGKLSTFLGTLQNKVTEWAEKLNPYLAKAFDFGSAMLAKIDPFLEKLAPLGEGIIKLYDATEPLRALFVQLWQFATGLFDSFGGGTGVVDGLNTVMSVLSSVIWTISKAIQIAAGLVIWLADSAFVKLVAGVSGAIWVFNALKVAMLANPFTAIAVGVLALVSGIKYAWDNIEGFRKAIITMWEVAKSVFSKLGGILLDFATGNILGLVDKIKVALAEGFASGTDQYVKDHEERFGKIADRRAARRKRLAEGATPGAVDPFGGAAGKGGADTGKSKGLTETVSGAKSTHITINLKSLVEHLTINAHGVQEGLADMESQVADVLLRILNSANSVAS